MKRSRFIWFMLLLSYIVLIFYLSSQSQESLPVPKLFENQDKVMHMVEYAGMSWFGLSVIKPLTPAGFVAWVGFSVVFAASDEIHQAFVRGERLMS